MFGRLNMVNQAGWKRSSEFSTHVRVNSKGLRGPEIPYSKPDGKDRVLVVGDSFTFGAQVEEDETFVARLGAYLHAGDAQAGIEPGSVETINAGVDGWNTINELSWLKAEGIKYAPDMVILMFYVGNDPVRISTGSRPSNEPSLRQAPLRIARSDGFGVHLRVSPRCTPSSNPGIVAKLGASAPSDDPPDSLTLVTRRSIDPET